MIENLTISYEYNGIAVTLRPTENEVDDNLPYVLAPMFERVIHDSDANEEITLNELCGFFGFEIGGTDNHKTTGQ
jgi:hypothetical protein